VFAQRCSRGFLGGHLLEQESQTSFRRRHAFGQSCHAAFPARRQRPRAVLPIDFATLRGGSAGLPEENLLLRRSTPLQSSMVAPSMSTAAALPKRACALKRRAAGPPEGLCTVLRRWAALPEAFARRSSRVSRPRKVFAGGHLPFSMARKGVGSWQEACSAPRRRVAAGHGDRSLSRRQGGGWQQVLSASRTLAGRGHLRFSASRRNIATWHRCFSLPPRSGSRCKEPSWSSAVPGGGPRGVCFLAAAYFWRRGLREPERRGLPAAVV
jgi:hypothetical protein